MAAIRAVTRSVARTYLRAQAASVLSFGSRAGLHSNANSPVLSHSHAHGAKQHAAAAKETDATNVWSSRYKVDIPVVPLTQFLTKDFHKRGSKPAVIDGPTGRTLSYHDLLFRIGTAARGFEARGVRAGTCVCVHMPNSPEYLVAFQAVASLGAVNTTSNPLYTASELAHQLRDSGATYVVTVQALLPVVREAVARTRAHKDGGVAHGKEVDMSNVFVLGEPSGQFLLESDGKSEPPSGKSVTDPLTAPVALPYSSGTTGLPKGVALSHYNFVANVLQCIGHPEFNVSVRESDVCLGLLPFYHIYGMAFVAATCVQVGATIVTLPKFDPQLFLSTMSKYRVTYAPLVPPIINFLAKHPIVDTVDLSSLRVIFSGAAPLDGETQRAVAKRLKCTVRQGYGMTELSPVSHIPHPDRVIAGSIGEAVPNTQNKIIDEEGRTLPPGPENVGELCVRGPNVMLGYLNNPAATAKTIVNGWLHTGDVAYRDADGNVFVVDRLKELIKTKGFQVAPAELEGLLLQHPGIMDAAVVPKKDERSGEVPVAFVVKRTQAVGNAPGSQWLQPTAEEISAWIAERVAEYKRLAEVRFVEVIPKSPSGKILRRVLREQVEKGAAAK